MSLTLRDDELKTEAGIETYRAYFTVLLQAATDTDDEIPAILWFSYVGLARRIDPPLEPVHDLDESDERYGHLHCSVAAPEDKAHMEIIAKLVNDAQYAGIALSVV